MPNEQSSSLHAGNKVASCNDLVTAILLRLPVRTLLRFKSVSKHWYSLITNPSFKHLHPDPPSGLFVPKEYSYLGYECVPFDIASSVKPKPVFEPLNNIDERFKILQPCNGLILCWCLSTNLTFKYYVYNPTTNQFATLPTLELAGTKFDMTLAFNPSESPHYRIVYVHSHLEGGYNCQIDIYSSETHTFIRSYKLSFNQLDDDIDFEGGVYWNNTIHWRNHGGSVSYFNLDQERCTNQIRTPFGVRFPNNYRRSSHIFESRDHLLLVENRPRTLEFSIHELKRDYSGWFVKYHVDLHQLGTSFPEIINPIYHARFRLDVQSLVLGEKEDDSFLVLKIPNKIVRFNLVSDTFHKLHDFTSSSPSVYNSASYPRFVRPDVYLFMASLYNV